MAMTLREFIMVWPVLKKQVKTLHVPWLDNMASSDRDPFLVLVSCIISLRTKDEVTGAASARLFRLARTPEELASLPAAKIERAIYPAGFYKVKAGRIKKMSADILERFQGRVPDRIDDLLTLEGVGRKTANLVVTLGYNKPGICVDTHVHRITNRWGLIQTKTPHETEFALRKMLPRRYWKGLNGMLVAFGQGICKPVSPVCSRCRIRSVCGRVGVTRSR
jgi:endonuclease-3